MTPSQVRRLETVAAAISPCLGCLQEDLAEAEAHADGPSSSLLEPPDFEWPPTPCVNSKGRTR